jgi:hypothetical protein
MMTPACAALEACRLRRVLNAFISPLSVLYRISVSLSFCPDDDQSNNNQVASPQRLPFFDFSTNLIFFIFAKLPASLLPMERSRKFPIFLLW